MHSTPRVDYDTLVTFSEIYFLLCRSNNNGVRVKILKSKSWALRYLQLLVDHSKHVRRLIEALT